MKQYIGAKVVFAEPAKRYAFKDGSVLVKRENCEVKTPVCEFVCRGLCIYCILFI